MKVLAVIIVSTTLFGCVNGRLAIEAHNVELTHKCQIDPYKPDCLQPPPVFKSS